MKTFKIFLSKKDNFINSALRLCEETDFDTEILFIEDIKDRKITENITHDDIVYFLCNDMSIADIISTIKITSSKILNCKFYLEKNSKEKNQILLQQKGIKVPWIFCYDKISNDSFPVFCKEKTHTGIVFQAYNKFSLDRFFEKFNPTDFYLEKAILGKNSPTKEFKVYHVFDKTFGKDFGIEINQKIREICVKIKETLLGLDIFSVDIVQTENNYYVIDVNPASGFFQSTQARKRLMTKVFEL